VHGNYGVLYEYKPILKREKIRIGYCGEMKVPYHIVALISN